jgi:mono/diheme cytochrome c family protein
MSAPRSILTATLAILGVVSLLCGSLAAQQAEKTTPLALKAANVSNSTGQSGGADLRDEGEKRFRANCGRCHQSPHKFPPRMVMTIERHMRVRATLTDEDMRAIVAYLLQ